MLLEQNQSLCYNIFVNSIIILKKIAEKECRHQHELHIKLLLLEREINMNKKKIVFVSHCIINTASKVMKYNEDIDTQEESVRKQFLMESIENNIHFIQLPCPEFTLYGSNRWGHTKDQFDNPFFRDHCKNILTPIIQQMREYYKEKDKFEILGIVGINGSPSCGVTFTCNGKWGGEFSGNKNIIATLQTIQKKQDKGVMFEILEEMLIKEKMDIKIIGLNPLDPHELFELIRV